MGKFTSYMTTHFRSGGCRLIARARDLSRQRDVTLHAIPGHWDCVGVSDGVDAWIAPTAAGPFFKTATGDVVKIMRDLEAGLPLPPVPEAPKPRRRVALIDDPGEAPPPRRRVLLEPAEPVAAAPGRVRRVLT